MDMMKILIIVLVPINVLHISIYIYMSIILCV